MTSASEQSKSRMSPTQVRAARRLRRMRRRRLLRYGGGTVIGIVAFAFIASLFIQGLPLGELFQGGAPEGPGIRVAEQGREHVVPGSTMSSTTQSQPLRDGTMTTPWHRCAGASTTNRLRTRFFSTTWSTATSTSTTTARTTARSWWSSLPLLSRKESTGREADFESISGNGHAHRAHGLDVHRSVR